MTQASYDLSHGTNLDYLMHPKWISSLLFVTTPQVKFVPIGLVNQLPLIGGFLTLLKPKGLGIGICYCCHGYY